MALSTLVETTWNEPRLAAVSVADADQTERIRLALGWMSGNLPKVDEETLARYYTYLSARLRLPFTVSYPQPKDSHENPEYRCTVVELLDPTEQLGDEFDGIFCKVRKGTFEVNLPLIELHVPQGTPQFQLIEDYWYWFWNWR
jgi:hypothetical protein